MRDLIKGCRFVSLELSQLCSQFLAKATVCRLEDQLGWISESCKLKASSSFDSARPEQRSTLSLPHSCHAWFRIWGFTIAARTLERTVARVRIPACREWVLLAAEISGRMQEFKIAGPLGALEVAGCDCCHFQTARTRSAHGPSLRGMLLLCIALSTSMCAVLAR